MFKVPKTSAFSKQSPRAAPERLSFRLNSSVLLGVLWQLFQRQPRESNLQTAFGRNVPSLTPFLASFQKARFLGRGEKLRFHRLMFAPRCTPPPKKKAFFPLHIAWRSTHKFNQQETKHWEPPDVNEVFCLQMQPTQIPAQMPGHPHEHQAQRRAWTKSKGPGKVTLISMPLRQASQINGKS